MTVDTVAANSLHHGSYTALISDLVGVCTRSFDHGPCKSMVSTRKVWGLLQSYTGLTGVSEYFVSMRVNSKRGAYSRVCDFGCLRGSERQLRYCRMVQKQFRYWFR